MKTLQWLTHTCALLTCTLFLVSCATTGSAQKGAAKTALYACSCPSDCKCKRVSLKPGKCGCGSELKGYHLVKIVGTDALLCPCKPDCGCPLDAKDPTKCACGQTIHKVSLKGTGLYFCNCATCTCNTVSTKPGRCGCGMDLKRAE